MAHDGIPFQSMEVLPKLLGVFSSSAIDITFPVCLLWILSSGVWHNECNSFLHLEVRQTVNLQLLLFTLLL